MWGVGPKETMAAELREDPIQRGGWVMGLFLKVNRLDFFVPKERATGFAIVSSVDAIRAPKSPTAPESFRRRSSEIGMSVAGLGRVKTLLGRRLELAKVAMRAVFVVLAMLASPLSGAECR
jgi:hypothetical protein